jgi:hypothetical protein
LTGLVPAVWIGAAIVALGAVAAVAIPAGLGAVQAVRERRPVEASGFGRPEMEPVLVAIED